MKLINIRFNKKNISTKINKKSLNWAINYLNRKISKSNYLKQAKKKLTEIECIIIDNSSAILDEYKNKIEFINQKESFSISPLSKNYNKIIIYGAD